MGQLEGKGALITRAVRRNGRKFSADNRWGPTLNKSRPGEDKLGQLRLIAPLPPKRTSNVGENYSEMQFRSHCTLIVNGLTSRTNKRAPQQSEPLIGHYRDRYLADDIGVNAFSVKLI